MLQVNVFVAAALYFFFFSFFIGWVGLLRVDGPFTLILDWEYSTKLLLELVVPFTVDFISCSFSSVVLFISGSVMLFSGFYMEHEKFVARFVSLVSLFVISMLMLIFFPNFLFMMVGWDGLGVTSFLLVVYYMDSSSLSSGMITLLINRFGDVFFIMSIVFFSANTGYGGFPQWCWGSQIVGTFMMLASMTKSAQIPFFCWLPEAMAAPTPVSALVHSSTLVTAGVYVMIRFYSVLGEVCKWMLIIICIITILVAGGAGCVDTDVKKVVALSTLSQVGMMMFCLSIGAVKVAFFHLLVHAFFKALMFMCVGAVIFYGGGSQDCRGLSGLWMKMPLVASLIVLTNLSLIGLPFMAGFYSKEIILSSLLTGDCSLGSCFLLLLSLGITCGYSVRMVSLTLQTGENSSLKSFKEGNVFLTSALLSMVGGSVVGGVALQMTMVDLVFVNSMKSSVFYGGLSLVVIWFINIVWFISLMGKSPKNLFMFVIGRMWFLKDLSGGWVSSKLLKVASSFSSVMDLGWVRSFIWSKSVSKNFSKVSKTSREVSLGAVGMLVIVHLIGFYFLVFL